MLYVSLIRATWDEIDSHCYAIARSEQGLEWVYNSCRASKAMTWSDIAAEQQRAAALLLSSRKKGCPRASGSRSDYAGYAHLAGKAPANMKFGYGGNNPSHDQVIAILDQLPGVSKDGVRLAVRRLRQSRILADYGVGQSVSYGDAKQRLRDCEFVLAEV